MRIFYIILTVGVVICLPVLVRLIKAELRTLSQDVSAVESNTPIPRFVGLMPHKKTK